MNATTESSTASRLLVVAAALLFSTGGAAIKATSLTSWQVAGFRSGVAALVLIAVVPAARRGWSRRVIPVGLAYASTLVLFVVANKLTTAANATFLEYTSPLYLLLLGPWLLREPVRRGDLAFMSAVALGMVLFFVGRESPVASAPDPLRGNGIAALSGVTWALTIAGLRWLGRGGARNDSTMATVVAGNLLAFLACLPMALPVTQAGWADLLVLLYLGVFQVGLAYICLTRAIRQVPAFTASLLLLVEPAVNPTWAWLLHGERPGGWALTGGTVILAATFVNTWRQNRRGKAERLDR